MTVYTTLTRAKRSDSAVLSVTNVKVFAALYTALAGPRTAKCR